MDFNLFFIIVIYVLISILIGFIIKVYIDTIGINKKGELEYLKLVNHFTLENEKLQISNQKIILVEDLNKSLFNRIFKIAKDLLSLQKLIFEK